MEAVLGTALLAEAREEIVSQLRHALEHRVTVERAIGALMARERADAVTAFNRLRAEARSRRRKVVELAAEILAEIRPST